MKATIVMTKDAIKKGEYKETSLDVQKKQADMLVVAIDDKYTLWLNKPITVKGRGIKKVNEKTIVVTDNAFDKLKTQYSIMFDL
ncbi:MULTISPECIES: hypothetical protein [Bacteroidales]|uniref:Uncharacterized protein n=1 Tax=Bacteroides acidifaciens TaxID=85831 RepID=A0A7K3MNU7_9BACE|nr:MULTISPECIES: hypothetical protein [Bacteroidales]MBF0729591.1 hypothetical protein [Bacteroides acidifaciens]MBF0834950.1 hypothetical protein [Bacteroides acidifaciens]NDO56202.1 hypothetical protein [Bacteroides acidifaciens]TFU49888.1 hypothetical protein E4T97_08560 [Bacteroides acidifaciens]GFH88685.1 hypothetical protein IMSAGC001_04129 [Bacteroides acidifaciens]